MSENTNIFFHLDRVANLLWIANYHYNKILSSMPQSISWEDDLFDEKTALLDLISDFIILQLNKFLELLPLLRKLEKKTYPDYEFSKSTIQMLQPLKNNEKTIRIWRNNLIAHSKSAALNKKTITEHDPNYIKSMREIHLISRLVVEYIIGFQINIPDYRLEMDSVDKLIEDIPSDHEFKKWWKEMHIKEIEIIEITNKELKKNGFDLIKNPTYEKFYE